MGALVTKREAMAALRVSLRTVDRYIADGRLTAVRLSERNTKITQESLAGLLTPTSPAGTAPVSGPQTGEAPPTASPVTPSTLGAAG
ncbi:helix-turn-helix domain-containing protein [Microbacterium enclense]|uniref:helix-turn-helix domain-containing protein n=1 Tax=Microbacterium enclense TaxID=993073 RepID=UPI0021A803E6|nr:helix-turn-helix domain-containing protein [Microbacterium enclense]MCT2085075.1 helix-turn-helix domain-containing protein [Microbacterium enclense]